MCFVLDIERDVTDHPVCRRRNDVYRSQVGALLSEKRGDFRKHAWLIGEFETDGESIVGIGSDVNHEKLSSPLRSLS